MTTSSIARRTAAARQCRLGLPQGRPRRPSGPRSGRLRPAAARRPASRRPSVPHGRVFLQCPGHHAAIGLGQHRHVGLGRQVLHQHLADALALEGHAAGEHLVEDHAQGVDVDLLAVAAVGHLGRHVVDGADALGLSAAAAARDELRQAVVADLDDAFVAEDIARLQVAVDDAAVVQIGHAGADAVDPGQGLFRRQAVGAGRPARLPGSGRRRTP